MCIHYKSGSLSQVEKYKLSFINLTERLVVSLIVLENAGTGEVGVVKMVIIIILKEGGGG